MQNSAILFCEKMALNTATPSNGIYFLESDTVLNLLSGRLSVFTQTVKQLSVVGLWEDISSETHLESDGTLRIKLSSPICTHSLAPDESLWIPAGTAFICAPLEESTYQLIFTPLSNSYNTSSKPTPIEFDFPIERPTFSSTPLDDEPPIENTKVSEAPLLSKEPSITEIPPEQTFLGRSYDYISDIRTREQRLYYPDESTLSLRFGIHCCSPFIALIIGATIHPTIMWIAFLVTLVIAIPMAFRSKQVMDAHQPSLEITDTGIIITNDAYNRLMLSWREISSINVEPYGRYDICLTIRAKNKGDYIEYLEPIRRFIVKKLVQETLYYEDLVLHLGKNDLGDAPDDVKLMILKIKSNAFENNSQSVL